MNTFQKSIMANPLTKTMPYAIFTHALLIFGMGFGIQAATNVKDATILDITIVNTHSEKTPEKASLIAQANQEASGATHEENRPRSLVSANNVTNNAGLSPISSTQATPNTPPILKPLILTTKGKTLKTSAKLDEQPKNPNQQNDKKLAEETLEEARLSSEVALEEADYSKMPKIRHLNSTNTKSAIEAAYIDQWARKIERIGTTNFPKEAIRRQQSGKLIVVARLNKAGKVVSSHIHTASGARVLDNAALRIVKIASPYPPLPEEVKKRFDHLEITRTFIFETGHQLRTE
jgi:protein TonB